MKHPPVRLLSCTIGILLSLRLLVPGIVEAQGTWSVVASPNPGSENGFNAVAIVSANDVWAVGVTDQQPLTAHWNGTAWSVVPNAGSGGTLRGVAAVSTSDVWAVGSVNTSSPPLIEHWNGTSWRLVKAPKQAGFLNAVAAVSTSDVWAVGEFLNASNVNQTLIEHWNGRKWSVVPSPDVGTNTNELLGVAAVSTTDVWAVGFSSNGFFKQTLAEFNP